MEKLSGIVVAMVTPLDDSQNIDFNKTDKLLDHLLTKDIAGIFILGTNGEAYAFSCKEKIEFAKHVIDYVDGRTKVIVGTGLDSTRMTIDFSKEIIKLHPYALSIVTPSFIAPTDNEVIQHYIRIANEIQYPLMIYNMPAKTGVNVTPEMVKILSKNQYIVGIKDSSGSIENLAGYIKMKSNSNFIVLAGSDSKILALLKLGGNGAIAATANFIPDVVINIYKNFKENNLEKAQFYQSEIEPLRHVLHLGTTPTMLKESLNRINLNVGPARYPAIMPTASDELEKIDKMIDYYKNRKEI